MAFLPPWAHDVSLTYVRPRHLQLKNGEIYRGLLLSAEDTMNVSLSEVLKTARNGQISKLPTVYLRGSSIRFIALPDLLKNAPVFQKVTTMKRKMEEAQSQRQGMLYLVAHLHHSALDFSLTEPFCSIFSLSTS